MTDPTPAFTMTVGSRQFGLDTARSDTDRIKVYIDFESRLDPAKSTSNMTFKRENPQLGQDDIYVEIAEFLRDIETGADLKYVEAFYQGNHDLIEVEDNAVYEFIRKYFCPYDYPTYLAMYQKDFMRRYNGFFHPHVPKTTGVYNPSGKNYNPNVGYSTKDAMHLLRVIACAISFKRTGIIMVNVAAMRDFYLDVLPDITLSQLETMVNKMLSDFESTNTLSDYGQERVKKLYTDHVLSAQGVYAEIVKARISPVFQGEFL